MSTVFTTCRNQNQSTTFNYYFMNDFQYLFYLCYFYLEFESLKRKALIVFNNGNIFEETQLYQDVITLFDKVEKVYLDGTHSKCETLSFYNRIWDKSNQAMENYNRTKNRTSREAAKNNAQQSKDGKHCFLSYTFVKFCKKLKI